MGCIQRVMETNVSAVPAMRLRGFVESPESLLEFANRIIIIPHNVLKFKMGSARQSTRFANIRQEDG